MDINSKSELTTAPTVNIMNFKPVKFGQFTASVLPNQSFVNSIGIDFGVKLTKIVFIKNNNELNQTSVLCDYIISKLDDTKSALQYVKDTAANYDYVKYTGTLAAKYENLCLSIFGKTMKTVSKEDALINGIKMGLQQIGADQLKGSPVDLHLDPNSKVDSKMIDMIIDSFKKRIKPLSMSESESPFPCIVIYMGATASVLYIGKETEETEVFNNMCLAGSAYLGLAKTIVDCNDYEECLQKTSTGVHDAADTLVQDVLSDEPNSPYGGFPKNMPIFSFGKCMDENIGKENLKKEDLLKSLIGIIVQQMHLVAHDMCKLRHIDRIYACGSLFQSKEFEIAMRTQASYYPGLVEPIILDFAYSKALGAMMTK